jgi:hypothetical protein
MGIDPLQLKPYSLPGLKRNPVQRNYGSVALISRVDPCATYTSEPSMNPAPSVKIVPQMAFNLHFSPGSCPVL